MKKLLALSFCWATFAQAATPQLPASACASGIKNFPFLKPWVEKLSDFVAPSETGVVEGALFYSIGATTVGKKGSAAWMSDHAALMVEGGSKLESGWLGPAAASQDWQPFWGMLLNRPEQDLLNACKTPKSCKTKLTPDELQRLADLPAPSPERLASFKKIVSDRGAGFSSKGEIWQYETASKPLAWQSLKMGERFPLELGSHLRLPKSRDTFAYERLEAQPGRQKPVVALINRSCEKIQKPADGSYLACTDLVVYNNHYFDFWAREVFFFPWCGGQLVLAYETMDIDQFRSNRLISTIFGGQIKQLLGVLMETRLKRLHMIGF